MTNLRASFFRVSAALSRRVVAAAAIVATVIVLNIADAQTSLLFLLAAVAGFVVIARFFRRPASLLRLALAFAAFGWLTVSFPGRFWISTNAAFAAMWGALATAVILQRNVKLRWPTKDEVSLFVPRGLYASVRVGRIGAVAIVMAAVAVVAIVIVLPIAGFGSAPVLLSQTGFAWRLACVEVAIVLDSALGGWLIARAARSTGADWPASLGSGLLWTFNPARIGIQAVAPVPTVLVAAVLAVSSTASDIGMIALVAAGATVSIGIGVAAGVLAIATKFTATRIVTVALACAGGIALHAGLVTHSVWPIISAADIDLVRYSGGDGAYPWSPIGPASGSLIYGSIPAEMAEALHQWGAFHATSVGFGFGVLGLALLGRRRLGARFDAAFPLAAALAVFFALPSHARGVSIPTFVNLLELLHVDLSPGGIALMAPLALACVLAAGALRRDGGALRRSLTALAVLVAVIEIVPASDMFWIAPGAGAAKAANWIAARSPGATVGVMPCLDRTGRLARGYDAVLKSQGLRATLTAMRCTVDDDRVPSFVIVRREATQAALDGPLVILPHDEQPGSGRRFALETLTNAAPLATFPDGTLIYAGRDISTGRAQER